MLEYPPSIGAHIIRPQNAPLTIVIILVIRRGGVHLTQCNCERYQRLRRGICVALEKHVLKRCTGSQILHHEDPSGIAGRDQPWCHGRTQFGQKPECGDLVLEESFF